MKSKNYSKIALSLVLSLSLYAQDNFSLEKQSLEDAIKEIAKKSNMSYLADGKLLKGKTAPKIENVEGVKTALDKILSESGLEATIENGIIIIKQKPTVGSGTLLEEVSVIDGSYKSGSADSGYLVSETKTLGVWGDLSLQDTPYSMSIMSSDFLENTISNNLGQVAKQNPLMQNNGGNSYNGELGANIRGFETSGALIDGIPLSNSFFGTSLKEVDRVEIISGLSGFLYGTGNVGGIINYALKYPTATPFSKISVGNNGGKNYSTSVDSSQKINDKLSARVFANYQDGDTVIENNSIEEKLVGVSFAYKKTDNLDLGLYYSHLEFKESGFTQWSIRGKMPDAKDFDAKKAYAPTWSSNKINSDKIEFKANYNFNDSLRFRTAYIYKDSNRYEPLQVNRYNSNTRLYSRTLMETGKEITKNNGVYAYLDGDFNTGIIHHTLTFGSSLATEEYKRKWMIWNSDGKTFTNKNDFMNWDFTDTRAHDNTLTQRKNFNTNIVLGDNITFNEQWSALVGVNYVSVENKTYNVDDSSIPYGKQTGSYNENELTPTISLIYKPIENLTTYATYIEALENGTVVEAPNINAGDVFNPLKSKQYEIGAKYSVNKDLLLSTALFKIEKPNDYQEDTAKGKKLTQNGKLVREGMEILVTGKATDNLTLMSGITYLTPKVEKADDKTIEGKESINVAKVQAKIYAEYRLPIEPKIYLNGGVYYTGTQWRDSANTEKLDAYTTLDSGIRYETKLEGYDTTFRIYASNITDEKYWENTSYLGDPRSVAFNVTMKF